MARVTGPLLSLSASGTVARTLVYLNWKGAATVRIHAVPYNPQSAAQVTQRVLLTAGVHSWQVQDAEMQASWNTYAEGISNTLNPKSGVNCYVSAYIAAGDHPGSPPS